jgi:hypothetical protein
MAFFPPDAAMNGMQPSTPNSHLSFPMFGNMANNDSTAQQQLESATTGSLYNDSTKILSALRIRRWMRVGKWEIQDDYLIIEIALTSLSSNHGLLLMKASTEMALTWLASIMMAMKSPTWHALRAIIFVCQLLSLLDSWTLTMRKVLQVENVVTSSGATVTPRSWPFHRRASR